MPASQYWTLDLLAKQRPEFKIAAQRMTCEHAFLISLRPRLLAKRRCMHIYEGMQNMGQKYAFINMS